MSDTPITDPNDPNYDATKDPNSPDYVEPVGKLADEPAPTTSPEEQSPKTAATSPPLPTDRTVTPPAAATRTAVQPNIPAPVDPENAWKLYAVQAINALYPHMRNGVDFAWGKPPDDPTGEPKMLHWDEKYAAADEAKIEELARGMAGKDPYVNYEPKPGLHTGTVNDPGAPPPPL